ncbi:MAG: hypothetical protein K1X57_18495, partial [Gemmataceae bacterium]|nr:hypothetical protein [Gemmataceae bacterium]
MIVAEAAFDLDEIVAAYEQRAASDPAADFADDLPPADHPLYESALRELVRVQMEFRSSAGQVPSAGDYFTRFPELRQADARQEICFEEYRLRRLAGELPDPEEFAECYGVDISTWPTTKPRENDIASSARAYLKGAGSTGKAGKTVSPYPENASTQLFQALERADPKVALQLATALTEFPEVGSDYHGYQLIDELGRGAFSRVYLALEDAVDGRCVALKVTGDARTEVAALARLRHTNIVPVYSVREFGLHQTV